MCSTVGQSGAGAGVVSGMGDQQNWCRSRSKNGVEAMDVAGVDMASDPAVKIEDERVESVGVVGMESVREKREGAVDVLRGEGSWEDVEEAWEKGRGRVCFHCSRSNAA